VSGEPAPLTRAERKRAEQAEELRTEIIDAAFIEFAENGYHQTTISDIATRLSISSGTFYNYFKNKRDIVDYVIDRLTSQLLAALAADNPADVASTAAEYHEQSKRIAGAVDAVLDADWRVPRMLLFEATSIDAAMTQRVLEIFDLARQAASAYLQNGVRRGFLRDDIDIGATADAITGLMISVAVRSLSSRLDSDARRRQRETVIELLMNGITARR
jgi:AcrR family transcriptional regulator